MGTLTHIKFIILKWAQAEPHGQEGKVDDFNTSVI